MIANKKCLLATQDSPKVAKAPRCSDRIARLYRSKERLMDAAVGARKEVHDRRAIIQKMVTDRLGDDAKTVHCERYLRDAIYRWILGSGPSPDTWLTYLTSITKWIEATGKRALSAQIDTSPDEILGFLFALEDAGASARTVALRRDVLRGWFGWLVDRFLLDRSPIRKEATKAFRVDHKAVVKASGVRQALTQDQAQAVVAWALTKAKPVAGFAVLLELVGGLRSHEVAKLEVRHVVPDPQDDSGRLFALTVPGKGKRSRTIVMETVLVSALRRYWKSDRRQGDRGPLLRRPGGGHYARRTIQGWAKLAAAVVGRRDEISSHDLRASCSTILRDNGAEFSQVQELLGHATAVQTERCYIRRPKAMTATTGLTAPETEGSP